MNLNTPLPRSEWLDTAAYIDNRNQWTLEQLMPYFGKFVAFTPDGRQILASGESDEEVDRKLQALGVHWSRVVHSYVDEA